MLQGVFSLIVNSASLFAVIYTGSNDLIWADYVGAAIWIFGFLFECTGDHQLKVHLADKTAGKKKFISWGLWKYTRHPNYFGEAVLWWGIWIIACSDQYGWVTVYAPLFITLLIRYVSGVPLLEAKYAERLDWKEYCNETNCFVPWFFNSKPDPLLVLEAEKLASEKQPLIASENA
jgi:steroid 5-alpha reductase family enzyme